MSAQDSPAVAAFKSIVNKAATMKLFDDEGQRVGSDAAEIYITDAIAELPEQFNFAEILSILANLAGKDSTILAMERWRVTRDKKN